MQPQKLVNVFEVLIMHILFSYEHHSCGFQILLKCFVFFTNLWQRSEGIKEGVKEA